MLTLCWIILGLPLLAAVLISAIIIPFEKRFSSAHFLKPLAAVVSISSLVTAFILSAVLFRDFQNAKFLYGKSLESSLEWIALAGIKIEFGILLNPLALLMILAVTGIAALVAVFSTRYMQGEEGYSRYFAAFSFFVFAMLGIVLANNLIQLFIFWELVGVASYLLIGFWFQKPSASLASKKAFLTTRIGDVGMMLGILLLFGALAQSGAESFNFLVLETRLLKGTLPESVMTWACLGLFLGAVGKSAQVPLHVWLPDAMEGPTPASALIHAATMVAAGVYMLARLFFLFELSPVALHIIAWTGALTALLAALMALTQNDLKKILAYSTLSQLGYMIMAAGLSAPTAGMFHLITHAFFKALLFLAAGSLIHAFHAQDIWQMSSQLRSGRTNLFKKMPITCVTFLIGAAALVGIPGTSGFFSKEEILAAAAHGFSPLFFIALLCVALTAYYVGRIITVLLFTSKLPTDTPQKQNTLHEGSFLITFPLIVLAVFSLLAGYLPISSFLDSGDHKIHHPAWLAIASVLLVLAGLSTAFMFNRKKIGDSYPASLQGPVHILREKFFFDRVYDFLILNVQEKIAQTAEILEQKLIMPLSSALPAKLVLGLGQFVRKIQNGWIQNYGLIFAAGWIFLLLYLVYSVGAGT